jgi:outer membrane receptor protein involved in Fe transport
MGTILRICLRVQLFTWNSQSHRAADAIGTPGGIFEKCDIIERVSGGFMVGRGITPLALLFGLVAGTGVAQTFRGTILGNVNDQTGAAIAEAKVTVKNVNTGLVRETATTDDGTYSAPELPLGAYAVSIEKSGFKTFIVNNVRVDVAVETRVDATLQAGDVTTKIEVSGDAVPLIETTANTLGGVIDSTVAANLPVNGRDYTKLIYLAPGVAGSPDGITDSPGSFGTFSLNGARGRANNYLLDGTDMNDGYRNDPAINEAGVFGTPATILPVEAVAEIRILSNFEPEYGRSAGAVINIVTKSGTNQWHGTALEFVRNTVFNARDFFNFKPEPQSPFHNNQFGGTFGGPIKKDKSFFFIDYEGQRESGGLNSLACVPDPTRLAAATNPVIINLLKRNPWPAPNLPSVATDSGCPDGPNLSATTNFSNRVNSAIIKLDHNFNEKNQLTGRYYLGDSEQSFPLALVGGGLLPNYNTFTPTRVQLISLSFVSVPSPLVVNEVRVGWIRFAEGFYPQDRAFDPNSIGLTTGVGPQDFGVPRITVSGFAPLGADAGDPRNRIDSNWHAIDNVSWKLGRHDLKFGYEFRRTTVSQNFDRNFRGKINFDDLSSFLDGIPGGGSQATGYTNRNTFENNHALYVQDSFRISPKLTLNAGVRWDYFGVIGEKRGLFTNFDFVRGLYPTKQLYEPDYNNFGPRVSLAYDPTGKAKTVIRAGYGIFYDAFSQDFFMGHLPWAPTFDAGPAYSGIGNGAISFGSANSSPLAPGSPVFGSYSPLGDAFGVDRQLRTPYMANYNLNIQQSLGRQITAQIGYVGATGRKLFRFRDINQPSQDQITRSDLGCEPAPAACVAGSVHPPAAESSSIPRAYSALYYILQEEAAASSNYNALQTSLRLRGWHGLQTTVNYSWSHSIDNASDGEDFTPNQGQPNDSTNARADKGNSSFDIRHRFTWNFIYEFPSPKGKWQKLTGGWGLNGIVTLQTGQPFHLNYNFQDDYDGSGNYFGRPDVVGKPTYNQSDPFNFLDLSIFKAPCTLDGNGTSASNCIPGTRHYGDLGRNSLRGPSFKNFDFSIFKRTSISERASLEFRVEIYNLLNHPNFTNPIMPAFIADAAPNGINTNGTSAGFYSLSATPDVAIGNPFLGGGGPRGLQLGIKLSF